jgi:hypothetical protein
MSRWIRRWERSATTWNPERPTSPRSFLTGSAPPAADLHDCPLAVAGPDAVARSYPKEMMGTVVAARVARAAAIVTSVAILVAGCAGGGGSTGAAARSEESAPRAHFVLKAGTSSAAEITAADLNLCASRSAQPGPDGRLWRARVRGIGCGNVGRFIFHRFLGDDIQRQLLTTVPQHVTLARFRCNVHPQPSGWRVSCAGRGRQFAFLLRP